MTREQLLAEIEQRYRMGDKESAERLEYALDEIDGYEE